MGTGTGLWHLVCIDDISLNENLETQVKAIKPIMLSRSNLLTIVQVKKFSHCQPLRMVIIIAIIAV